MSKKIVALTDIDIDSGIQTRDDFRKNYNFDAEEYARDMKDGIVFPPVRCIEVDDKLVLVDGFHRVIAAGIAGQTEIEVEVTKGTEDDAYKAALQANATNGIRRTDADKRNAVKIALGRWPDYSDRAVAQLCAVSHPMVASVRKELVKAKQIEKQMQRKGRDGKAYTQAGTQEAETVRPYAHFCPNCGNKPKTSNHSAGASKTACESPMCSGMDFGVGETDVESIEEWNKIVYAEENKNEEKRIAEAEMRTALSDAMISAIGYGVSDASWDENLRIKASPQFTLLVHIMRPYFVDSETVSDADLINRLEEPLESIVELIADAVLTKEHIDRFVQDAEDGAAFAMRVEFVCNALGLDYKKIKKAAAKAAKK
jgi:hypothetical protein